jgi:hypothetical protein
MITLPSAALKSYERSHDELVQGRISLIFKTVVFYCPLDPSAVEGIGSSAF